MVFARGIPRARAGGRFTEILGRGEEAWPFTLPTKWFHAAVDFVVPSTVYRRLGCRLLFAHPSIELRRTVDLYYELLGRSIRFQKKSGELMHVD